MLQFLADVKQIALSIEEKYCAVKVEFESRRNNELIATYGCYIHSATWTFGKSPELAMKAMRDHLAGIKEDIADAVIGPIGQDQPFRDRLPADDADATVALADRE